MTRAGAGDAAGCGFRTAALYRRRRTRAVDVDRDDPRARAPHAPRSRAAHKPHSANPSALSPWKINLDFRIEECLRVPREDLERALVLPSPVRAIFLAKRLLGGLVLWGLWAPRTPRPVCPRSRRPSNPQRARSPAPVAVGLRFFPSGYVNPPLERLLGGLAL